MSERIDAMLDRLPPLWRIERGSVLRQLLSVVAVVNATFDEEMDRVQRSHWVDTAFDREDLARLAALFDLPPAPWEPDELYRARIKAVVRAHLGGSVTRAALEEVILRILQGVEDAIGARYFVPRAAVAGGSPFSPRPTARLDQPAFIENPPTRRRSPALTERAGRVRPLDHVALTNGGMQAVPLQLALWGMRGGRTALPVLANLRNGGLVGYAGTVGCGQRLDLVARQEDDSLRAFLDGRDVTDRLFTSRSFDPAAVAGGAAGRFEPVRPDPAPRPLRLDAGANELWFLSLALFDVPGLDAAMLAMASPNLRQGKWNAAGAAGTIFDQSVFYQPPAAVVDAWWDERTPATFDVEIPTAVVRRLPGDDAEADRDRLFDLLQAMVDRLRAAGVDGRVQPRPAREVQRAADRLFVGQAQDLTESASPGRDALAALGALFDVTDLEGSRFA